MTNIRKRSNFNVDVAAETLYQAMKGWGTNEDAIIDVTAAHNYHQRQQISERYKAIYGKDLVKKLKSELSGNFASLVKALYLPIDDYLVKCLYKAVKGIGTDERALIEILCSRSNYELNKLKSLYKEKYGNDLEHDLKGDLSGGFRRLIASVLSANRDELSPPDKNGAERDAREIFEAAGTFSADKTKFFKILSTRSYPQLRAVFDAFRKISGKDIEEFLKDEFDGYLLEGFLGLVRYAKDPAGYYAKLLNKAMSGAGTDDGALIRIIVTTLQGGMSPDEPTLKEIKLRYLQRYGRSLASDIEGESSGDYRTLLMKLVGN